MNTSNVEYGGAVYTVHRSTVRSSLTSDVLLKRLAVVVPPVDESETGYRAVFCQIAAQVTSGKKGAVTFPTLASSDEDLRAAWDAYLDIDRELAQLFVDAIAAADRPLNDRRGLPKEQLAPGQVEDPE